jgi:hypothetical protein
MAFIHVGQFSFQSKKFVKEICFFSSIPHPCNLLASNELHGSLVKDKFSAFNFCTMKSA